MKRVLVSVLAAAIAVVAVSTTSFAGANSNAKIQLHLLSATTKIAPECTTRNGIRPACNGIVTTGALYPVLWFAHVLVTDANVAAGVAGTQFGVKMNPPTAIVVYSWKNCGDQEFPSAGWPGNNTGNAVTWNTVTNCQRTVPSGNDPANGVCANAGYLYVGAYAPSTMFIIPRPVDGQAKVADCSATEDLIEGTTFPHNPSHLGGVGFGGPAGYNPCALNTAVESTTWGAVKSIYGNK